MRSETRKVQRLGTSSLVITIPKEWVKRFKLKPGDKLNIIDEGNSLRIVPSDEKSKAALPLLDLTKMPEPSLLPKILHCLYVSGVDEALIKLKEPSKEVLEAKKKALDFIGMEIYEEREDLLKVKVLIDSGKVDIPTIIKLIGYNSVKAIEIIERAIKEGITDIDDEVQIIKKDFVRYQHAIIRYLMVKYPLGTDNVESYQTALATSYLGFINDVLINILDNIKDLKKGLSKRVLEVLEPLKELIMEVASNIASPSLKRLGPLCLRISLYESLIDDLLKEDISKDSLKIIARLIDVARVLNIIACVLLCKIIMAKAEWVPAVS